MTPSEQPFRCGFIAIVGRPNVGKSTLLNRILGQKIAITSHKPQTTRNRILGIENRADCQLLFLDTPGIHQARGGLNRYMVDQALAACSGVDAVLLLVDADHVPGPGEEFILEVLAKGQLPVVLGINKIDRIGREELLPRIAAYAERFDFREIVPLSGLTGEGVDQLLPTLIQFLPEGPPLFPEDMVTDLPERFIVAEMIREQVLKQVQAEIPYGVAIEVERFEERPGKNLVSIGAVINVERDTHKQIVVGKGGQRIRSIGQAARFDIERLLGTRVFLELFVKVRKNWTDSQRMLREFGYD